MRIVWCVIIIMWSLSARAANYNPFQDDSIQALYLNCKSENDLRRMACIKYLEGVYGMMEIAGVIATDPTVVQSAGSAYLKKLLKSVSICPSEETSTSVATVWRIFINWAERHPTEWNRPKAFGAWSAISEAYPCR